MCSNLRPYFLFYKNLRNKKHIKEYVHGNLKKYWEALSMNRLTSVWYTQYESLEAASDIRAHNHALFPSQSIFSNEVLEGGLEIKWKIEWNKSVPLYFRKRLFILSRSASLRLLLQGTPDSFANRPPSSLASIAATLFVVLLRDKLIPRGFPSGGLSGSLLSSGWKSVILETYQKLPSKENKHLF